MPIRVGTTVHALPAPDATVTKCGIPLRQPGSVAGFAGERTKARVTCPDCRSVSSADFARGWDAAIARGVTGEDDPEPDAELDRIASDLEAERAGTAGMIAYTRTLEGLPHQLETAWGGGLDEASSTGECEEFYIAVEEVLDTWRHADPERQGGER